MEIIEVEGRLIQIEQVSDVSEEGMVVECWDVTPALGAGLLFTVLKRHGVDTLRPEMAEIPVPLLLRVLGELAANQ